MKNHLLHDGCLLMTHFQSIYFDGGIENHLSNDSIGGMKNHLLNDGCLLVTHFQPVYFHGGTENRLSNDLVGGMKNHLLNAGCLFKMHFQLTYFPPRQDILKRTLSHYKACFHYQAE